MSGYMNFNRRLSKTTLSVFAVLFYLFLYGPIIILIIFSFNESRYMINWTGFSLKWYQDLFNDYALKLALKNSLIVAVSSTAISTVIGTMLAIAMERYRFPFKTWLDGVIFLPIIIPDIAMAVMLLIFFVTIHFQLGLVAVIISHVAFNISFVAVVVRARLASLTADLEEAANDLYADEWRAFWRVTFPLLIPGILGGALLAFTLSLDDFVITSFTTGPSAQTLPVRIWGMAKTGVRPDINALSTLMLFASLGLVVLSLWLQQKGDETL